MDHLSRGHGPSKISGTPLQVLLKNRKLPPAHEQREEDRREQARDQIEAN